MVALPLFHPRSVLHRGGLAGKLDRGADSDGRAAEMVDALFLPLADRAGARAAAAYRQGRERLQALGGLPRRAELPALRAGQAHRAHLYRRFHGAQAGGQAKPAQDLPADDGGDDDRGRAAAGRARHGRLPGHRFHHVGHPVSRRGQRQAVFGVQRGGDRRLCVDDRALALAAGPHLRLSQPLVGIECAGQRLSALARADCDGARRVVRRRPRRQHRKTALPAGSAHRLSAGHHRRGAGPGGRRRGDLRVLLDRAPRLRHRPSGAGARPHVQRVGGTGHRRVDRRAGFHQYRREPRSVAHQGADAAADELWRLGAAAQLHGHCRAAARRFREPDSDARRTCMTSSPRDRRDAALPPRGAGQGLGRPGALPLSPSAAPVAVIMAGGTGGHIFPGIAVGEGLRAAGWTVHWMGAPTGMEAQLAPRHGFDMLWVRFGGLRGKGLLTKLLLPFNLLRAFWQALRGLRRVGADVVVSMGGYIAFPGGLMSAWAGAKLVVHEQNAVAGLANKVLARLADRSYTAFPDALPGAQWVGNPVRAEICALPSPEQRYAGRSGPLQVLVVGGSLGAQALNSLVPQALALLPAGERPQVRHQSGAKHLPTLQQAYLDVGVQADCVAFIDDMAAAYAQADLVICRAGASTVTEVACAGVAALFVPFPHAVDDHQTVNAKFLAGRDAALLIQQRDLSAQGLAELLQSLDRPRLLQLAQAARGLARPDAVQAVVAGCNALLAGRETSKQTGRQGR